MTTIPRAATGARVYAHTLLAIAALALLVGFRFYGIAGFVFWVTPFVAIAVRSWFLRVSIDQDRVVVTGWWWRYAYRLEDIDLVDTDKYTGTLGVDVGYIPFVGAVRVLSFRLSGERWRSFPSTLGRARTVRGVCRRIREEIASVPE